ncbi:endonuclease/exonuclease/phosphatase family protein [Flavobacterium agricola]|uniref:Endonuclease/exonuclease/phosphatase family protein n=1 Tax=Flavobacterium agricola TaxID=2870839 RepID=A0ABY6M529_9FLAO|nr:endonuclease/exonuclease/phosphatase family protein [Flavobacterium agricola]UYW02393.1 endonuclease/exonuclease/phosphatase family protein [Flavobacterium agricola]
MRLVLSFLCFVVAVSFSFAQQFSVISWNIANLGKSKSETTLEKIADIIAPADIICLQEVVAGYGGAQAVAKIVAHLNRKNNVWDYSISDPTLSSTPHTRERYAYIWKRNKIKIKRKFELESIYKNQIEREPYIGSFTIKNSEFKIFSFHAVPKKSTPEKEIKYFKEYSRLYGDQLIFLGDFNVTNTNSVFNPIYKQGFKDAFPNQKTTLKQNCVNNNCLANAYDHVFYPTSKLKVIKAEAIPFYTDFNDLKQARKVSDHLPLYVLFQIL